MPKPGILEPCIRDDDYPCFWVYRFGKSIKKGLLYLCILLFFRRNYPTQQWNRMSIANQAGAEYVILLRGVSTPVNGDDTQLQLARQHGNNVSENQGDVVMKRLITEQTINTFYFIFDLSITG